MGITGEQALGAARKLIKDAMLFDNINLHYEYDATTDANYTIIRIFRDKLDGTKQFPLVYAPNGADSGTMSTYDMNTKEKFLLAINAGLFNMSNNKPDGIVIQEGKVIQNSPAVLHSARPLVIDSNGYLYEGSMDADANELVAAGAQSAVCGFMAIISNYEAIPSTEWTDMANKYNEHAQRQIIGQFGNGDYAIITCEGRGHNNSDGWTIEEAQSICIKWGLKFAYNLDGGGSTEIMLGSKHLNTMYENSTGRIVPTFIVFNGTTSLNKNNNNSEPEVEPEEEQGEIVYVLGFSVYQMSVSEGLPASIDGHNGRVAALCTTGDEVASTILSNDGRKFYLINVPPTATKVTVTSPDYYGGISFWNNQGDTTVREVDAGWPATIGTVTYSFEAGAYKYFTCNFKNASNTEIVSVDTSNWSIVFE